MDSLNSGNLNSLLVIGSEGFLGKNIVKHFKSKGFKVYGIDRIPPENINSNYLDNYFQFCLPDKRLGLLINQLQPSFCVNSAGNAVIKSSFADPISDYYSGPVLIFELLEQFRRFYPDCKIINLSSAAVYGNSFQLPISEEHLPSPISPYGFHKLQCELICSEYSKLFGLYTANIRIFSAYGIGLHRQVIWDICKKAITQKPITLFGTGRETRDFINIKDVIHAIELIFESAQMDGEVYNVASGKDISISDLAMTLLSIMKINNQIQFDGIPQLGNPLKWQADISKINSLGFQIEISLEKGLIEFVHWFKNQNGIIK